MRSSTSTLFITTALIAASAMAGCGGFFEDQEGGGGRGGGECDQGGEGRGGRDRDPLSRKDAGAPVVVAPDAAAPSTAPDASIAADASAPPIDGGTELADAGDVAPPDAGRDCSSGQCPCVRDNDCPDELICDHAAGICTAPPIQCGDRATEADCLSASTCQPVYAGQDCRDSQGGECTSSDTDCTCASFSFALCVDR